MVSQRDLVLELVDVSGDFFEIDLAALARDVERVPDLQVQLLILRRVVDAIFADKLQAAF